MVQIMSGAATRACLSSPEGPFPRSRQPDTPRLPTQLPKVPPPNRLDSHTSEQFGKKTPVRDSLSIANATSFCPLFCRTRLNTTRIMEGKPRRNFRIPNPRAKVRAESADLSNGPFPVPARFFQNKISATSKKCRVVDKSRPKRVDIGPPIKHHPHFRDSSTKGECGTAGAAGASCSRVYWAPMDLPANGKADFFRGLRGANPPVHYGETHSTRLRTKKTPPSLSGL